MVFLWGGGSLPSSSLPLFGGWSGAGGGGVVCGNVTDKMKLFFCVFRFLFFCVSFSF